MHGMSAAVSTVFPKFYSLRHLAILRHLVVPMTALLALERNLFAGHDSLFTSALGRRRPALLMVVGRDPLELEPMTRIELVTSSLPRMRSTI